MPDIIHLLPDPVANQIAAGEVIQRPASVVKELVENSIDAASTNISVFIKDGGKTLIQVIDNGCGMSETDARMSFERHATSKIKSAEDLFEIRTMGFRGEALASIAAVAQVTLKTRKAGNNTGTEINISGSSLENQEHVSCQTGTNFCVKNLFFNIPARRKFLKSTSTEFRHIIDEFIRIALAHPDVELKLDHNGSEIYNLPQSNLKQRIIHIFGRSINNNLTPINTQTSIVEIKGFIGKPEMAKKKFGEQYFFINKRFMRHSYFHRAVMSAYEQILPPDAIPSYFIFFDADPKTIDVNIHPTKTEIKFEDEQAVFQILKAAVRETIGKSSIAPSINFDGEGSINIPVLRKGTQVNIPEIQINQDFNPFNDEYLRKTGSAKSKTENWEKLYDGFMSGKDHPDSFKNKNTEINGMFDACGIPETGSYLQLKNRFILTPVKSGIMVIDQKRAYERIIYEDLIHSLAQNSMVTQQSLFPETIEINQKDYSLLSEIMEDIQAVGFDISDFGNNSIVINGCPAEIKNPDPKALIESVLEDYRSNNQDIKKSVKERIARSLAKVSGNSFGVKLNTKEMQELIDRLFGCEDNNFSPSGKKIITIIDTDEFEKKLG